MSGGSRGIGLAILVECARRGANSVLLAKTAEEDPRLPGTVHTAVREIEAVGGSAVAFVGDVREDEDIQGAVDLAVSEFGGVDIVINNASALNITGTEELSPKRYDLMQDVNSRGTFMLTRTALPWLKKSDDAQVLTLSPPLNLNPHWLGRFPAYMLSKYGMTLLTLGFAAELRDVGIRANCLWPQSTVATAAVKNLLADETDSHRARSPQIMADAAVGVLTDPDRPTGQTIIDVDAVTRLGIEDLSRYGGGADPELDFFVDAAETAGD